MVVGLIYFILRKNDISLLNTFISRRNIYDGYKYQFSYPFVFNIGTGKTIYTLYP